MYAILDNPVTIDFLKNKPDNTHIIIIFFEGPTDPFVIGTPEYKIKVQNGLEEESFEKISTLRKGMIAMGPDEQYLKIKGITHNRVLTVNGYKTLMYENERGEGDGADNG